MNQNTSNNNNPNIQNKDLITSEDVAQVISGNEQALIEQLERAKQVAQEQLLMAQKNPNQPLPKATREQLEAEIAKKEQELQVALAKMNKQKQVKTPEASSATMVNNAIAIPQNEKIDKVHSLKIGEDTKVQTVQNNPQPVPNSNQAPVNKTKPPKQKKEKKPSNFKYVLTVMLFIALFAFVYFLPEISHYMAERNNMKNANNQVITTGNLKCKKSKSDKKFDYSYENTFAFTDSKLIKLTYKVTTKGSLKEDEEELEKLKDNCDLLKKEVKGLDGITVRCSLSNQVNTVEQDIRYADIDKNKLTSSYIEAGGTYPNYKYGQNIDKIEKEMKASGYNCERTE